MMFGLFLVMVILQPSGDPPPGTLGHDNGWPAGTVQQQLDGDVTLVPFGKGALFVPSMTSSLDEPPVSVWQNGRRMTEATSGTRIVLPPGHYGITLGSGSVGQQFSYQVQVREGFVTVIPVTWSGLTVHVVDEQFSAIRSSYEIIRMTDREYLGIGFGRDEQAGEPVSTWILKPGLYKIVQVGDTYRARKNFSTVRLIAGRHTQYNLVLDPETGDFLGAGEATAGEIFRSSSKEAWGSLVLGGDARASSRANVRGAVSGRSYAVRVFLDGRVSLPLFGSHLFLRLQVEEGQTQINDLLQQDADRVDLDALYVYLWAPWSGPYLRFAGETNIFGRREMFSNPRKVEIYGSDGGGVTILEDAMEVELQRTLGTFSLKEGAGVNLRLLKSVFGEATFRLGGGGRHFIVRRSLQSLTTSTSLMTYQELASTHQYGVEATLIATIRPFHWILLQVELDSLLPFVVDQTADQIILDVESILHIKLTQYVSLNYVSRLSRNRALSSSDLQEHDVFLRFSVALP